VPMLFGRLRSFSFQRTSSPSFPYQALRPVHPCSLFKKNALTARIQFRYHVTDVNFLSFLACLFPGSKPIAPSPAKQVVQDTDQNVLRQAQVASPSAVDYLASCSRPFLFFIYRDILLGVLFLRGEYGLLPLFRARDFFCFL